MKLFQIIQKDFALLGIDSIESKCSRDKLVLTCLLYGLGIILSILFLVIDANTFIEYVNNIYIMSALGVLVMFFAICAFKRDKIFRLINHAEQIVDESECVFWIYVEKWKFIETEQLYIRIHIYCRIHTPSVETNIWENQSTNGKVVQDLIFHNGQIDTSLLDTPNSHPELFPLLHNKFEKWSFWAATFALVRSRNHVQCSQFNKYLQTILTAGQILSKHISNVNLLGNIDIQKKISAVEFQLKNGINNSCSFSNKFVNCHNGKQ